MSGEDGSARVVLACSRCGQRFPDLDSLQKHLCPYLAAKARGFTPLQASIEARAAVARTTETPRKPVDATPEFLCDRCGQEYDSLDTLLGHACPMAAPPAPVYDVSDAPPILPPDSPSKTLEAIRKASKRVHPRLKPTGDIPVWLEDQIPNRRKPRRSSADVAADKAAKQLQRQAREQARMIEAAHDFTPDDLPTSGAAPISGPAPVENPSHPVRNPIRPARWKVERRTPLPAPVYCLCGMVLPIRPGPKCENCGRAIV